MGAFAAASHHNRQKPLLRSPQIRLNRPSSPFRPHKLLTSRRLRRSWRTCALHSMRGNRMGTISQIDVAVHSADELQHLLAMHGYRAKQEIVKVLYLALRLHKPLLLEGPPGAGKTQ